MWNSQSFRVYRSLFLLIRVRSGSFRLTLPLALFLIDEALEIISELLWLSERFIPHKYYSRYLYSDHDWKGSPLPGRERDIFLPHQVLELCRELVYELRRHGRYSLVKVEVGKGSQQQHVSLEFF